MSEERTAAQVARSCNQFLSGHYRPSPKEYLQGLADRTSGELEPDTYGTGDLIEDFEQEVAELLGKESAVFMPSGTMAQQIALAIWSDRVGNSTIAMHPTNHLDRDESWAYEYLHNLKGLSVGDPNRVLALDDLQAVREPIGMLVLELPQRRIGGQLPAWDDLVEMTGWARAEGIVTHMDGARLWESGPFYGRPYDEIASLFDTVYVSMYKGLGGLAGCVLAGPDDLIAESRIWQHRHGGRLIRQYPYVLSARFALEDRLERMPKYHERAKEIATTIGAIEGITIVPDPPQTNMMHVYVRGDRERLLTAALDVAEMHQTMVFHQFQTSPLPDYSMTEISIGDAGLDIPLDLVKTLVGEILDRASLPTELVAG